MAEEIPASKPGQGATRSTKNNSLRTIGLGYGVVALFLAVFLATQGLGARLHSGVGQPRWALMVAVLAIVPLFLPALITYVLPHISSLKIPNLMEVSFAKAEAASYSLAELTSQLSGIAGDVTAPEYASMMTSYSSVIVNTILGVRATGDTVIVVDLGEGTKWIPPNLYILALLARHHTAVRLIAFTESRRSPDCFMGMCSPQGILDGLGARFPVFKQAGDKLLGTDQPLGAITGTYFSDLAGHYQRSPEIKTVKEMWLNGPLLSRLLGAGLYSDQVEWTEPLPEGSVRFILQNPHPYVAAVKEEQIQFFIERDRFALLVARQIIQMR